MHRAIRNLSIGLIAFGMSAGICRVWVYAVSLEAITGDISFYNGKLVQVESFAHADESGWYLGEPFERMEAFTFLRMENNSSDIASLYGDLSKDLTETEYNRARVRVTGRLVDNCSIGITCCFGPTMSIEVVSMTQLAPVERYSLRSRFDR